LCSAFFYLAESDSELHSDNVLAKVLAGATIRLLPMRVLNQKKGVGFT